MTDLLVATQNKGKIKEYARLLADTPYTIIGLQDVGLGDMDVEETGTTFLANATIKAETYGRASGKLTLADDSGLVVDALDGRPGVYSARYGKPEFDDAGRRTYLLDEMKHIPDDQRSARFMCVIAIYDPETETVLHTQGACEGEILREERSDGHGFGYDALFQPQGYDKTFAELDAQIKNSISHRGIAVQGVPALLEELS